MRSELENLSEIHYWIYGISESDIQYTLELVQDLIAANQKALQYRLREIECMDESEQIITEIKSDVQHYSWVNEQSLWQFCLWRLQGIFEALIVHTFLPKEKKRRLTGLRSKLDAAKDIGLPLSKPDENELLLWNKLRNAISHAPPEQYRPIPLKKSDLHEYAALIHRVITRWKS